MTGFWAGMRLTFGVGKEIGVWSGARGLYLGMAREIRVWNGVRGLCLGMAREVGVWNGVRGWRGDALVRPVVVVVTIAG
jgi:hypothetical protein